jgi:hypothetical protein
MQQERARAAKQIAEIRQLQLHKAQADASAATRVAERRRGEHEQAAAEARQCRDGQVRALGAQNLVDVTVLQQWMHLAAMAERHLATASIAHELAQAELQQARSGVHAGERRLENATAALRQADRRLQRKREERQLESLEDLFGARTP